jgi:membrane-associated phospholipid phosphatase
VELAVIQAIQSLSCPALDIFFQAVTLFGEPLMLVLLVTGLYWAIDKRQGERLAFALAVSLPLCGLLKQLFRAPRPIGEPGIRSLRTKTATGYSFPSGHTQSAATAFGSLADMQKNPILRWGCGALMLLVGLSRLYLGVHYPKDVLAGLALGLLCSFGAGALFSRVKERALLYLVSAAALAPFLFYFGGHELTAAGGCLLGFGLAVLFEKYLVGFTTEVPVRIRLLRWLFGLALLGSLAALLKALLPAAPLYVLLRYALLVFTGMGLYPWLFTAFERNVWKRKHYLPGNQPKDNR